MSGFTLFTNSADGVVFEPEFGFRQEDKLIQNSVRTRSGLERVYQFGEYSRWKIPIRFVSSGDKLTLNTWWKNNTELYFMDNNDTSPVSMKTVRLVNRSLPINQPEQPYDYEWRGNLELEEY